MVGLMYTRGLAVIPVHGSVKTIIVAIIKYTPL
jgi:hypothetical protein